MKHTGKESRILLGVDLTGKPHARFKYSITDREGNSTPYNYAVNLTKTPCNFGGVRYWFVCQGCSRRVGGLYLAPGGRYFRCRHCNNLTYHSRNRCLMGSFGHTSRQIDKLRSEIKRWTWGGRPTRKVRRLHALVCKMDSLGEQALARLEGFTAQLSRN
jgi:hypothetical protein